MMEFRGGLLDLRQQQPLQVRQRLAPIPVSRERTGRRAGVKRMKNSADLAAPGESVVREFLQRCRRERELGYKDFASG
jgi:hypothetical protein